MSATGISDAVPAPASEPVTGEGDARLRALPATDADFEALTSTIRRWVAMDGVAVRELVAELRYWLVFFEHEEQVLDVEPMARLMRFRDEVRTLTTLTEQALVSARALGQVL